MTAGEQFALFAMLGQQAQRLVNGARWDISEISGKHGHLLKGGENQK